MIELKTMQPAASAGIWVVCCLINSAENKCSQPSLSKLEVVAVCVEVSVLSLRLFSSFGCEKIARGFVFRS